MELRAPTSDGLSVALFRLQAQTLFHVWAAAWLHYHHPIEGRDDLSHARLMATAIQTVYWNALYRNPTTTEWVRDFVRFTADPLHTIPEHYDHQLRCFGRCEDRLDVLKTWKMMYQSYGSDDRCALNAYSVAVGTEFMKFCKTSLDIMPEIDWLHAEHIWDTVRRASQTTTEKINIKERVRRFFRFALPDWA